jgi:hypothetical protein
MVIAWLARLFLEVLLIAVSRETARKSCFIHIISAPLAAQTAFNRENLVVPQGCHL